MSTTGSAEAGAAGNTDPEAAGAPSSLGAMTWPEMDRRPGRLLLALPLGSLEQHGPHLPLDTDTRIAVALCERLARRRPDCLVAPAVAYGASGEHAGFPGTLSSGHRALARLLVELVRAARTTFAGVVIVSGHGGNQRALRAVAQVGEAEGDPVLVWSPSAGGDAHAGRTETSLLLALDPASVRLEAAAPGRREPLPVLMPELRAHGVRAVSPNGVLGDPAGASAAEGHRVLDQLAADLAGAVARWRAGRGVGDRPPDRAAEGPAAGTAGERRR